MVIFSIIFGTLGMAYSQSILSKSNYEVEKLKIDVDRQKKRNEGLAMKIDELASLDKIRAVAKEEGLTYNNLNIKQVNVSKSHEK